jgi:hypothetical protein
MNEICQSPCLWVGDHLDYCCAPRSVPSVVGDPHWTWVPEGAEWAVLIKLVGHTVAYAPRTDCVSFVAPAFALANACAPHTVFLCQCMRDTRPELGPPRLLVVDLLRDGGKSTAFISARGRYARLRELEPVLAPGAVALQWCGEKEALNAAFLGSLPHPVQALVAVGDAPGEICVGNL